MLKLFYIRSFVIVNMAFFSVTRYGENDGDLEKEDRSKSILQKLHAAASQRKSQQFQPLLDVAVENEQSPTKKRKTEQALNESVTFEKSQKKQKVQKISDESVDSGIDTERIIKCKKSRHQNQHGEHNFDQKKKKKRTNTDRSSVSETQDNAKSEGEDIDSLNSSKAQSKKQKKNKLKKHDDGDVNNGQDTISNEAEQPNVSAMAGDSGEEDGMGNQEAFTVLGEVQSQKLPKVQRVLPHWLSHPTVVTDDLRNKCTPLDDVKGLDADLVNKLRQNGIKDFFPVQAELLPELLHSFKHSYLHGNAGFRPSDICCSAPTGSGKTLAYVLPIIQALQHRVVCQVRALVVLPVRDLVTQVYKVFQTYCKHTNIKVGQIVGSRTFTSEQQMLVRMGSCGFESQCDILISTPGRLVDHINITPGFTLKHLRFLVIDEADRIMDEIKHDWLRYVEDVVYSTGNHYNQDQPSKWDSVSKEHVDIYGDIQRKPPGTMTVANACKPQLVLQKLLFSATLSQNPEKLQQLNLFRPKLFTSVVDERRTGDSKKPHGEFIGKFTTPAGLTELFIESTAGQKPLVLLRFIQHLKFRHILCFTNSIETAHRLYWLIKLTCDVEVREMSSKQLNARRSRILKQFADGKIDIIVCSDAMARGMDIDNVRYVISYDSPQYLKTYIHRAGRTARAGKVGTAITLLQKKEILYFKRMLKEAGKSGLQEMRVKASELKPYVPHYTRALGELQEILQSERQK